MEPKLWIDIAKARLSVNRRDSEAMAGRCHREPGNGNKADAEYEQGETGRKPNNHKGDDVQHHAGGEHHPPLVPEPVNQHAQRPC